MTSLHKHTLIPTRVTAWGPASLSNLGPGFDTLGLCVQGLGDVVEAWWADTPGVTVQQAGEGVDCTLPLAPGRNTAAVAAGAVLRQAGVTRGIGLRICKGIPPGSGLGSSSASAVAGAWAANLLLETPLDKNALVAAVLEGEAVASGSTHGDNVLPALLGGLVLVSATEPTRYRALPLPRSLHLALALPAVEVLTQAARAILPATVPLREAVHNASELAFMVAAFLRGDWEEVGRRIMADHLVEPVRATLVPCYEVVRQAALEAGALGCALSGSGPALFALTEGPAQARTVADAMGAASRRAGIAAQTWATEVDLQGARRL